MPPDLSIPVDIIEVIIQALTIERDKHLSASDANTLRACALVSRAFNRPATHALFRTVSLPMNFYTGNRRNRFRNDSLHRFRVITRDNTSLLSMIQNLSIEIDTDAGNGEEREIWTILEEIVRYSLNLQSVSTVGKFADKPWRWMERIENGAHQMLLTQILQKSSVRSLHLHNVLFDPSLDACLPMGLTNIQHICCIGVHFAQLHSPALTTPLHNALPHITSASIQVKAGQNPLPDAILQRMASRLITLEIAYTLSAGGTMHTWRADLPAFPRLRHLHIREPIDICYLTNTPLAHNSTHTAPSQTGIETMALSYRLASPADRAALPRASYIGRQHAIKFGQDRDLVCLAKRSTWKALRLDSLRQSHPKLRRLDVLLEVYADWEGMETSSWGYNWDILASQLREDIKDSIVGGVQEDEAAEISCSVSVTVDLIVAQTM